jgi:hypothetical protein
MEQLIKIVVSNKKILDNISNKLCIDTDTEIEVDLILSICDKIFDEVANYFKTINIDINTYRGLNQAIKLIVSADNNIFIIDFNYYKRLLLFILVAKKRKFVVSRL